MPNHKLTTAVILAAGQGTKFWPYNVTRNKTAFPIANIPAIYRLVDSLIDLSIQNIIVVMGDHAASVRAALRGSNAQIHFIQQAHPTGTADAVLQAESILESHLNANESFLVCAGDIVTSQDNLATFISNINQQQPYAAALIQPLSKESPSDWLIPTVKEQQITRIEGHPRDGRYRLAGVYAFQLPALAMLRDNPGIMDTVPVGGMPPIESEIARSVQMMIEEGETVLAVETVDYHVDLDKPWHILEANYRVIESMRKQLADSDGNIIPASARIHDCAEIEGSVVLGENAVIGNRVVVRGDLWLGDNASVINGAIIDGPVVIGRDVKVRDYCQIGGHSTLGPEGVYGHGAEFSGVALAKVYCYHYCEIWGVVGQAVDFGAATVCGNLRFDDGETVWRVKGRAEVPTFASNAAYFGDFCRTGVNAIIMPGRRLGVYSCVGPGVVAYDDVPDRQMTLLKQELTTQPWGPERYGW